MKSGQDHRIEPSQIPPQILARVGEMVRDRRRPVLVGVNGQHVELPDALNDVLGFVVEAMERDQAIFLVPEDAPLTTQAAAEFLGMSRPYLLRLLDAGKIPFHRVGTHRRIMLRDLRAYQAERNKERRSRLDALNQAVEDADLYDRL